MEPSDEIEIVSGSHAFQHGGLERTFLLHVPENRSPDAPLVMAMHGYSGNASGLMEYAGLNAIADENGFIICYPEGTIDAWGYPFFNVGYDFHDGVEVDDVSFLRDLALSLQASPSISDENVFATGMSNGGDMSYLLACEASQVFKAIAPVAGTMMKEIHASCAPERPMPVFGINGTADEITWYDGDMDSSDGWGAYLPIPDIVDFWVDFNELNQSESIELPNSDPSDGSVVFYDRYWSNETNTEFWLYRVEGGGHDWPGSWGNMDIHSSADMWDFFSQYLDES